MGKWTEYNPATGLTEVNSFDEVNGVMSVHKMQDVEPVVDHCRELANSGATDGGIKRGLWHYASIPMAVQYEMLTKYGVNIHNRNHWPEVFRLVNEHYPYLKTTTKHHSLKGARGKTYAMRSSSPKLAS